jgi:hypothetical protein
MDLGPVLGVAGLASGLGSSGRVKFARNTNTTVRAGRSGTRFAALVIAALVIIAAGTIYGTSYLAAIHSRTGSSNNVATTATVSSGNSTAQVSGSLQSTSATQTQVAQTSSESLASAQNTTTSTCTTGATSILDNSAIDYTAVGTKASLILSTTKSRDVVIVYVTVAGPAANGSAPPAVERIVASGSPLSFNKRASVVTGVPNSAGNVFSEEEWFAITSSPLFYQNLTVILAGPSSSFTIIAFAVSGVNTDSPFDSNHALPAKASGTSSETVSEVISTSRADEVVIAGAGMASLTPTAGSGYTYVQSDNGGSAVVDPVAEYAVVCGAQADLPVTFGGQYISGAQTWVVISDALVLAQ